MVESIQKIKLILFYLFVIVTLQCCYEDDFVYVKEHTGLYFPSNGLNFISNNNNLENYLTAIYKMNGEKLDSFVKMNTAYLIDCGELTLSKALYTEKYQRYIEFCDVCFTSRNDKDWRVKIEKEERLIFLEIWY